FQAEDGIRDGHVTGVQTCALPISTSGKRRSARRETALTFTRPRRRSRGRAVDGERRLVPVGYPRTVEDRPRRRHFGDVSLTLPEIGRASCRERVESWVVGSGAREK